MDWRLVVDGRLGWDCGWTGGQAVLVDRSGGLEVGSLVPSGAPWVSPSNGLKGCLPTCLKNMFRFSWGMGLRL
jgi:hypothetical protein